MLLLLLLLLLWLVWGAAYLLLPICCPELKPQNYPRTRESDLCMMRRNCEIAESPTACNKLMHCSLICQLLMC
jgi:hypothetical protein